MKNYGFTLVELLAVISLIAIVGLITIPVSLTVISKSEIKTIKQTAQGIINASEIYNAEHNYTIIDENGLDLKSSKIQFEKKEELTQGHIKYDKYNDKYTLFNVEINGYCINGSIKNIIIDKNKC